MNCAVVTIGGSSPKLKARALSGPSLFLANIGNGCTTAPNSDVLFPNPGSVIEYGGSPSARAAPIGSTCASQVLTGGSGTGGNGGNGGSSGSSVTSVTSGTSTRSAPTAASTGTGSQGKTTVVSSFKSSTLTLSSPTPLYPSSLNSPTLTPVGGSDIQSGKVYPTATDGAPYPGTATNTAAAYPATGQSESNLGCDYWRTQGYVCSAAAPSLLAQWAIIRLSFGFLAFSWVCSFLGVF